MQIVHIKQRNCSMTLKFAQIVAKTLSCTNREAFILTKEDPFIYLNILKEYGIKAFASPVLRNRKIVGYKFKNAA